MSIKILIAEDHEHTRKGLVYGLKTFSSDFVISEAEHGLQALEYVKQNNVDVILMDVIMPVMNGIDATKNIIELKPEIKVIMLTSMTEKETVMSSFKSGACAYCSKSIKINELYDVIRTVLDGATWLDPAIAGYVLEILKTGTGLSDAPKNADKFNLTNREKEILTLIAEGKCNKTIADELVLSLHTVKNHVKSIIQKLSVVDRTQAAIRALKENII